MEFKAEPKVVSKFFRNFKSKILMSIVVVYALAIGIIYTNPAKSYYTDSMLLYVLIIIALFTFYCYAVLVGARNDFRRGNLTVDELVIDADNVKIKTFSFSFLKIVSKPVIEVVAERNLIEFYISPKRYSFKESIVGSVYILSYAGDKFLVCEKFFINFELLKESLTKNT